MSAIANLVDIAKKEFPNANYFNADEVCELALVKYNSLVKAGRYNPFTKQRSYEKLNLVISDDKRYYDEIEELNDFGNAVGIDPVFDALYELGHSLLDLWEDGQGELH